MVLNLIRIRLQDRRWWKLNLLERMGVRNFSELIDYSQCHTQKVDLFAHFYIELHQLIKVLWL